MHVHDVFNISSLGFVWCVSVWAQECRGMHMEVRQLTEIGSLLPPVNPGHLLMQQCLYLQNHLAGPVFVWGVQLCVCKHSGVKGKLGVHSSITWVPGME